MNTLDAIPHSNSRCLMAMQGGRSLDAMTGISFSFPLHLHCSYYTIHVRLCLRFDEWLSQAIDIDAMAAHLCPEEDLLQA